MGNSIQHGSESSRYERVIASLADSTASPVEEVRMLFKRELARLESNARVRTHIETLVTSNVRAVLRRRRSS